MLVEESIARIRARDPLLHAFLSTRFEQARALDQALRPGASAIRGLPFSLKDIWDVAGEPTTAGSWRYRDRRPEQNSPVYEAFRDAGAVLMGKTNCPDLSIPLESDNYLVGSTRNPHGLKLTAGGSSGGAAAAVADSLVAFDWGSDIGGSIRMPAGFCGIYGLRLSSETWPSRGHFPPTPQGLEFMLGQGPMTRSLALMRELLEIAAPRLRTGKAQPEFAPRGVAIYAPTRPNAGEWSTFTADVSPPLAKIFTEVCMNPDLPSFTSVRNTYASLWGSHFTEILACDRMGTLEGIGAVLSSLVFRGRLGDRRVHPRTAEILALIAVGGRLLYRDRAKALANAGQVRAKFQALWSQGYLVAMPTCEFSAPRIGRTFWNWNLPACALAANVADATALAIPFGRFANGMPRSLQFLGPPGSEMALLGCAERLA